MVSFSQATKPQTVKPSSEVAKGASEMILTDDNFTSIVRAVEKGRSIYAGIQKLASGHAAGFRLLGSGSNKAG